MSLYKVVDGVSVLCTAEEESALLAEWAANAAVKTDPLPDGQSFIADVKVAVGGIIAANELLKVYPAFLPAVQHGVWQDVQDLVINALSNFVINDKQYAAIKDSAAARNIPITL